MELVTIVVMIALIEYNFFAFKTGFSRGKYGIKAPAVSGDENWERFYRVQMNTLEQLIVFIPAIYAFGYFVNSQLGCAIGCVFVIGRGLYFWGYTSPDTNKRTPGFVMTFFSNQILVFGSLIGAIWNIFE